MRFLVVNGVNLNMTGIREQNVYGNKTLDEINAEILAFCKSQGDEVEFFQSNIEGEICSAIQNAYLEKKFDAIVLNAGAYTHYSFAIRDSISAVKIPVAEVHLSNVFARENFRSTSVLSEVCQGSVSGFNVGSYISAIVGLKYVNKEGK